MMGEDSKEIIKISWVRIATNMREDPKIKLIRKMPEGETINCIWIDLICMAGECNQGGLITISEGLSYTEQDLATVLNRELTTVQLAIRTFQTLKMIEWESGKKLFLINFTKHQNKEGLDHVRELNAQRQKKFREVRKQLRLTDGNTTVTLPVTLRNGGEGEGDKNREDIDKFSLFFNFLKENVNQSNYNTCFKNLVPVERTDHTFVLGARQEYIAEYAEKQMSLLERAAAAAFGEPVKVNIVLIEKETQEEE